MLKAQSGLGNAAGVIFSEPLEALHQSQEPAHAHTKDFWPENSLLTRHHLLQGFTELH